MKIVYFVWDCNRAAGGVRVIFEHTNRLIRRGHQVEIWCERPLNLPSFSCLAPTYNFYEVRRPETDVLVITELGFLPEIIDKISAKKYFLLVQHHLELIAKIGKLEENAVKTKEIFSHFPDNCQVLSVSSWVKERLQSQYQLSSALIVNGVNFELFHPNPPLLKFKEPALLFFYSSQAWKGIVDAFIALNLIKTKMPNCMIIMIGSFLPEPCEEPLYYSIGPAIYFCRPNQQTLAGIYSSASVFVSSSWAEGFGLPGLEAMACGVPVVTTDSGGVREYAIPEETAIVVPPRNPESLAEGILRVLKDKSLSQKLIQNGLKKAKEFDWEKSIDELEKVFRE